MKLQKITNYSTNLNKDLFCKKQNKLCQSTSFKARLSSQLIKKEYVTLGTMGFIASGLHNIFQNIGTGNILNQDSDGNTIFNKVNDKKELILSDSQFASINEQLKNSPEKLKKLYLTPNNEGMLPAHRNLGLIKQKKMHEVLKDYPEILAQMYLTEDCYNHIPTDRISYKEDFSEFIEIISALKDQPNVISEILEYYPEGDINKAWRQDKGWYDVRTGKPLSSKQQEIIDRRKGQFSIVNKEVPFETVSTIVYLLKDSPETLLKLLSNITFFIDINNHAQVLNLFKETAPEVLADMYLNGKVSWAKPGEYEEYYPSTYRVSEPKIENVPLTENQKNEIINDIIELALDSDLSALKSKKLLNEYCRNIPNYNIIIKQLEELEIEELIKQEKSNKN